jgi:hypothetical protein
MNSGFWNLPRPGEGGGACYYLSPKLGPWSRRQLHPRRTVRDTRDRGSEGPPVNPSPGSRNHPPQTIWFRGVGIAQGSYDARIHPRFAVNLVDSGLVSCGLPMWSHASPRRPGVSRFLVCTGEPGRGCTRVSSHHGYTWGRDEITRDPCIPGPQVPGTRVYPAGSWVYHGPG